MSIHFVPRCKSSPRGRWQLVIDVSRQALYSFHSGDLEDMDQAADGYRAIVLAVLRFSQEWPDVCLSLFCQALI